MVVVIHEHVEHTEATEDEGGGGRRGRGCGVGETLLKVHFLYMCSFATSF